jgi:hypothetical protein
MLLRGNIRCPTPSTNALPWALRAMHHGKGSAEYKAVEHKAHELGYKAGSLLRSQQLAALQALPNQPQRLAGRGGGRPLAYDANQSRGGAAP